ncbi:TetR family transcriptional regulator [Aurantimonas aggregata]|uniref:TetR family transcriptional regulator n=1 Tax=Aurantimonas aggregata TaxID=2047720 RepID=A0A6L9MNQ1_9HYPH|nr:TetR/AcrR family transcriptional regulator [Aurantimonas aggregata]NDV89421.1 TetR family transcriptional regulator [Aurantimonas aggregata]
MSTAGKHGRLRTRGGTRERVVEATLGLFNERGPDRVTTAEIARTVGINEGNLYYHFRTKESLVLALFARFEADAETFAVRALGGGSGEARTYEDLLSDWFRLVWAYRFLFRDLLALAGTMPALATPFRKMSARMRGVVEALLRRMIEEHIVNVPKDDIEPLLANVWIVSTYWAVYLNLQKGIDEMDAGHLDWGLNQVSHLFKPFLIPTGSADVFPLSTRREPDST